MNYFRCTVGGSGNKWKLTVTCNAVFAGLPISCTDGVTTQTKTCPASSPYVVKFDIPNAGNWTVSAVYDERTHSVTVEIVNSAILNYSPKGSTATPTDDIQTWLNCAGIWDKSYTTITQVLGDSTTLLALISNENAVDYMARSTTWASSVAADSSAMTYIGANAYCADSLLDNSTWATAIINSTYFENVLTTKVPTMTSSTTPSGTVSGTASESAYPPYKAFDGSTAIADRYACSSSGTTVTAYLRYDFTEAVCVKKYTYFPYTSQGTYRTTKLVLAGSNDGSTWEDIDTNTVYLTTEQEYSYGVPNNKKYYSKYRLTITANCSSSTKCAQVYELQFYGRTQG